MCEIKTRICGSDLTLSSVNAVVTSLSWIIWSGRFLFPLRTQDTLSFQSLESAFSLPYFCK